MDNGQITQALNEIALWLEIAGENPFKIRSYVNAARTLESLGEDAASLAASGRLRELDGIGAALEAKIIELTTTGRLAYLDALRARFPETLMELKAVQGLGAKSIKTLYDALGVDSLDALRSACVDGRVAALKGFGKTREKKILEAIAFLDEQRDRFRLNAAWNEAERLRQHLLENAPVVRVEIAGSARRFREVVKDVDLVAASEDGSAAAQAFCSAPGVQRLVSAGPTKSTVIVEAGMPVDLRVVSPAQFPFAWLHFTGSKEHNVVLRRRARERSLKLNEYGLFQETGVSLDCGSEADVYAALDLPYLPPEVREGLFEFDGPLPSPLVEQADLLGVVHCHSTWSDGANSIEEMSLAARDLGYAYLVMTDHSRSSVYVNGLSFERVLEQHREIDALNARLDGFRVVKGIEADILADGSLDYEPDMLAAFEFVVASIHNNLEMSEKEATRRLVRAIENPYAGAIGHLTGRLLLSRPGYPVKVDLVVDAAVANDVAIEINANPRRLDMDWRYLRAAADKGARFVIGPDAHRVAGLRNMRYGLGIARKGALVPEQLLNCSMPEEFIR